MKNCKEMVDSLLERRAAYTAAQKKKRARILASVSCVCLVALLSLGVWQSGILETAAPGNIPGEPVYAGSSENDTFCGNYWVVEDNNTNPQESYPENCQESHAPEEPTPPSDTYNRSDVCHFLGNVIIDGVNYMQFSTDTDAYTPDICLGAASDYEGTYSNQLKDLAGKLYTTKEDPDILLVIGEGIVALKKQP